MQYKDYYKILGVARTAPADEIKRAYRKQARRYHPDVSKETAAEERFKEVQEAYEVLKDSQRRAAYDQLGSNWRQGQEFRPPPDWRSGFDFHGGGRGGSSRHFSDFFDQMFGGTQGFDFARRGAAGRGRTRKPQEHTLEISLEESCKGSTRTLRMQTGPGDGMRTLNVRIPAGVVDGQKIRLAGQGARHTPAGPPSDLYLVIRIQPHPLFRLHDKDVSVDLPLAPWEAALGATVEVPTPTGRINLNIPGGSQAGRRLRLRGRGLPGDPPGDFYVELQIVNPPHDNPAAKALFQRMARDLDFNPRAQLDRH